MKCTPGHGDQMQQGSPLAKHTHGLSVGLAFFVCLPCTHAQYTAKPWSFSGNVQP